MTGGSTHRDVVARMPWALAARPRDHRGYPVPWFVPRNPDTGEWDFRYVAAERVQQALREERCWTCGGHLLALPCAFVVGPMCALNRVSAEPPSHVECALYAAKACPFLARPKMQRPSASRPVPAASDTPGVMIDRNPGVALVWITDKPAYMADVRLFDIGDPVRVRWFARSRPATRDEVLESIDSGLPLLRELADRDGPDAVAELARRHEAALALLPEASAA